MAEAAKPSPVPTNTICSVCGLAWEKHTKRNQTIEGCVKLLRAELAKRPAYSYWGTTTSNTAPFVINTSGAAN